MSWYPPEQATYHEDKWIECSSCEFSYHPINFTNIEDNYDNICNDCFEEEEDVSDCCGAEITLNDICLECKEHI